MDNKLTLPYRSEFDRNRSSSVNRRVGACPALRARCVSGRIEAWLPAIMCASAATRKPNRGQHVLDVLPRLSDLRRRDARRHGDQILGRQRFGPVDPGLLLPGTAKLRAGASGHTSEHAGPMTPDPGRPPRHDGKGATLHGLGHPGDQHAAGRQPRMRVASGPSRPIFAPDTGCRHSAGGWLWLHGRRGREADRPGRSRPLVYIKRRMSEAMILNGEFDPV